MEVATFLRGDYDRLRAQSGCALTASSVVVWRADEGSRSERPALIGEPTSEAR